MYFVGVVVAYAIYRGRDVPMVTGVPSGTWKTTFLIGGLVGGAYIVVFVLLVSGATDAPWITGRPRALLPSRAVDRPDRRRGSAASCETR